MAMQPIASKERLEELGMEVGKFRSCSLPDVRKIKNRGTVSFNAGCPFHHECEWAGNTQHMQPRDENDDKPRPRNVATRFIKPNPFGDGDIVMNSYCPCFKYHRSFKKRDGKNNEILEVVGGEGSTINVKSHKKTVNPDGSIYLTPFIKKLEVPRFPDPEEVPALFEDIFAAQERKAHRARTVDSERERRLEGSSRKESRFEGVTDLEVGPGGIGAQPDKG